MAWGKKKNPGYSYFAVGATLEGRLCFTGIIRLDGRVNGEIVSSGTLVVEETAVITGSVLVESIILSGTVYGDITAFKQVQLNGSAKVYGHISYGELSIEGALHEGSSHKLSPEEVEETQRRCHEIMEEAAARAERSQADQTSLAQYAAGLEAPEKPAALSLPDKRVESPKKAVPPPGRPNPAQSAKSGEAAAPSLPAKPGETPAPALPGKPGAESSAGKGGNGWASVKAGSQPKGGGAPPAKAAAPATGKISS